MSTRTQHLYNNFTMGEISPRLYGAVTWDKYARACATLENMILQQQGGVTGRPGTRYVEETKDSRKKCRLLPFRYSDTENYVLEVGDRYIRFYKNGVRVHRAGIFGFYFPVEVISPFVESELFAIHVTQLGKSLAMVHPNHPPQRLTRYSDRVWRLSPIPFDPPPSLEYGTRPYPSPGPLFSSIFGGIGDGRVGSLTADLGSPQVATTEITFHATAQDGTPPYEFKWWEWNGASWTMLADWSATDTYAWTPAAGSYQIQVWMRSAGGPIAIPVEGYASFNYLITAGTAPDLTPVASTGFNVEINAASAIFLASDVEREILVTANGSQAVIKVVDSPTQVHADIIQDFPNLTAIPAPDWKIDGSPVATITPSAATPTGAYITLTLSANGWREGDVGKYVLLSGGVVKITAFSTALKVTGQILLELDGVVDQPPMAWSLEEAAWSADNGYPSTVGYVESRLALGGTEEEPDAIWLSASFSPLDFSLGATDDAAISIKPGSGSQSAVRWFSARRKFLMGTASDEFVIQAPNDAALTPKNIKPVPTTPHGSGHIMPIRAEHTTLFVTGNGRIVRELTYAYDVDDYLAPDLLSIAEHLTRDATLVDLVYQIPPDSSLWGIRSDGVLLGCAYMRDQDIVGWHRHTTQGLFESVCTIPAASGTTEQVWVIVSRTIGGDTKRYVEYFDAENTIHSTSVRGLRTDSCFLYNSTPVNTVPDVHHLEGKTVQIVGDGSPYPDAVVTGGDVVLVGPAASKIEIGLSFTKTLKPVAPEVPSGGTSMGRPKSWGEIQVLLKDTIGCTINGEVIPFRAGDPMGSPPALFSGFKKVNEMGWDKYGYVTITQAQPLPITVLAITGVLVVGE